MRVLRAVVQSFVLTVLDTRHDFSFRCTVAFQLICDEHAWHILQALQQLAEEPLSGLLIPATLHEDVEHIAILVYGSPQVVVFAIDLDEHFIEVPLVARSRTPAAQFVGICLTELEAPLSNRFIGESHTTHCHDFFNVPIAESKAKVEPHTVVDDFCREAMAMIER